MLLLFYCLHNDGKLQIVPERPLLHCSLGSLISINIFLLMKYDFLFFVFLFWFKLPDNLCYYIFFFIFLLNYSLFYAYISIFCKPEAAMRREMDRKEQERKKNQKVDFISGGTQAGIVATAPKLNVPISG